MSQKIIKFLTDNPGYTKCGNKVIADRLGVSERSVKKVKSGIRKKVYNDIYINKLEDSNVLIIGDTHFPFEREGYLEHCLEIQKKYKCNKVYHIGDVVDNCFSSFHETNPDGHSASDELSMAIDKVKIWADAFPSVKICLGNHDLIINRKAFSSGLSTRWIKGLSEVLECPKWQFDLEFIDNNILYTHGTGTSGENAAYNKALNKRISVIQGHLHSVANIKYNVSQNDVLFAMQVGCGVDDKRYAFDYAKAFPKKFVVSCGVVVDNGRLPIIELMKL